MQQTSWPNLSFVSGVVGWNPNNDQLHSVSYQSNCTHCNINKDFKETMAPSATMVLIGEAALKQIGHVCMDACTAWRNQFLIRKTMTDVWHVVMLPHAFACTSAKTAHRLFREICEFCTIILWEGHICAVFHMQGT